MNECKIVEDLLPLYVENLTSGETGSFVKAHLETCESCSGIYGRMTAPVRQEEQKGNYKKALWGNTLKVAGEILLVVVLVVGLFVYGLWELGFLDRKVYESPDGNIYFEVLDNTEAGFFRGGAYIVTPDGRGRDLRGDNSYRDFNAWFSPDEEKYFVWIEFEGRDETYLKWSAYGYEELGDRVEFEFKNTYYPAYEPENRDFLGLITDYLREHPDLPADWEEIEYQVEGWAEDSASLCFTFMTDSKISGTVRFICADKTFTLEEANYEQSVEIPLHRTGETG